MSDVNVPLAVGTAVEETAAQGSGGLGGELDRVAPLSQNDLGGPSSSSSSSVVGETVAAMEEQEVAPTSVRVPLVRPPAVLPPSNFQARHQTQALFDLSAMGYNRDDVVDDAAQPLNRERHCCKRRCCREGRFGTRLWNRLKLDHLVADNAPGFILLKTVIVIVVALLIDKGTRNPDSVTTTFVAVLSLAAYIHVGVELAKQTLVGGLLGAVIGTLIAAACYLPPSVDPEKWMRLLSVPLSVGLTQYIMMFGGIESPAGLTSGLFSSLFVVLIPFAYPPLVGIVPVDDPRNIIWQTLLVRVIALLTAVVSAYLVNMVISASAPLDIYRQTMFFAERLVWRTQKHRLDPLDARVQNNYAKVVSQVALGPVVSKATDAWIFSDETRAEIAVIRARAKTVFRFLAIRTFLELYLESLDARAQDRDDVLALIDLSMRNVQGGSLRGDTLEEELLKLEEMPETLHVEKAVLKGILLDLENTRVKYRAPSEMVPFWGIT